MTPLDRMILAACKCVDCGTPALQGCGCAAKRQAAREKAEFARLMQLPDDELLAVAKERGVLPPEFDTDKR